MRHSSWNESYCSSAASYNIYSALDTINLSKVATLRWNNADYNNSCKTDG